MSAIRINKVTEQESVYPYPLHKTCYNVACDYDAEIARNIPLANEAVTAAVIAHKGVHATQGAQESSVDYKAGTRYMAHLSHYQNRHHTSAGYYYDIYDPSQETIAYLCTVQITEMPDRQPNNTVDARAYVMTRVGKSHRSF